MARTKKPTRSRNGGSRKRALAAKKGWQTRKQNEKKRSIAAKKGWETRRRAAKKSIAPSKKRREKYEPIIVGIEGPHGRAALTMDWNGEARDIKALAKAAQKDFPNAVAWQYAMRFRFVPDVTDSERGEERWVSIPFSRDFKQQLQNAIDYAGVFTSGQMNYGVVIPLEVTIVVQE